MLSKQGILDVNTTGLINKRQNRVEGTEPQQCPRDQPYLSRIEHEEAVTAEFVDYFSSTDFDGRVSSRWAGWMLHITDAVAAWSGRNCDKQSTTVTNRLTYVCSNTVKREVNSSFGIVLYCGFEGQVYVGTAGIYTLRLFDDQDNKLIDAFEFTSTKFTFWLPLTTRYGEEFSVGRKLRAEVVVSMDVSQPTVGLKSINQSGKFYLGFLHEVSRVCT